MRTSQGSGGGCSRKPWGTPPSGQRLRLACDAFGVFGAALPEKNDISQPNSRKVPPILVPPNTAWAYHDAQLGRRGDAPREPRHERRVEEQRLPTRAEKGHF